MQLSPHNSPIPHPFSFCGVSLIQKFCWRVSRERGCQTRVGGWLGKKRKTGYFLPASISRKHYEIWLWPKSLMTNRKLHICPFSIGTKVDNLRRFWTAIKYKFYRNFALDGVTVKNTSEGWICPIHAVARSALTFALARLSFLYFLYTNTRKADRIRCRGGSGASAKVVMSDYIDLKVTRYYSLLVVSLSLRR